MSFGWPFVLLSLLAVPALLAAYVWLMRRRRRTTVPYSSVALIRQANPARSAWRRHVPFALVLTALACLGLAGARPQVSVAVPVTGSAVILALDVSGSMCATDVEPNRLAAAQQAVRDFVRRQEAQTRIGLVVFSGFAQLTVAPTTERKPVLDAVDSLTTGRGTTIGAAILKSVDAIAEINPDVQAATAVPPGASGGGGTVPGGGTGGTGGSGGSGGVGPDSGGQQPSGRRLPPAPEIVVLLTDGANTAGIEPVDAAKIAATRGVRIYPIGFGTTNPTGRSCTAAQLGGTGFPNQGLGGFGGGFGGGGGGRRNFLSADEDTLRQVANITGGRYFAARDAEQLQGVLADLPRQVDATKRDVEISVALAGLAAALMLLSIWAATRWSAFP
jgi:Ca-activated chloride channel homolog